MVRCLQTIVRHKRPIRKLILAQSSSDDVISLTELVRALKDHKPLIEDAIKVCGEFTAKLREGYGPNSRRAPCIFVDALQCCLEYLVDNEAIFKSLLSIIEPCIVFPTRYSPEKIDEKYRKAVTAAIEINERRQ
jgi:hypothetical protein